MMHAGNLKRYRAFSLPELLIVVAIIAILAMILMANFMHARAQAGSAACESNERALATAMEEFATDNNGTYPSAPGPITLQTFGGPGNPYVDPTALVDPVDGQAYAYVPGAGTCSNSTASFEIHDLGGHDSVTLQNLPQLGQNADSVAYCAGLGVAADDSQQFAQYGFKHGH
ncbi:MAG TPA: type II secretion system protein [Candidatus Eremiobacteraceae bacterium]|nr:type II secretion system protein [Candidatus Eremiobacteraceae bacterium]